MGQEEVELYSILNEVGVFVGKVQFTDHLAIKGFKRTLHVIQSDVDGKTVVDERWVE